MFDFTSQLGYVRWCRSLVLGGGIHVAEKDRAASLLRLAFRLANNLGEFLPNFRGCPPCGLQSIPPLLTERVPMPLAVTSRSLFPRSRSGKLKVTIAIQILLIHSFTPLALGTECLDESAGAFQPAQRPRSREANWRTLGSQADSSRLLLERILYPGG